MASEFSIQILTNATPDLILSTFSLYDALNPLSELSSLPLSYSDKYNTSLVFADACGPDLSAQNCTASCQNPSTVFRSLGTLRNCMAYPSIADQYAHDQLSPEAQKTAENLGIQKRGVNDTVSKSIISTVGTCLKDYCDSLPGCSQNMKAELDQAPDTAMLNFTSTFYIGTEYYIEHYFDLCSFLPDSALLVNQDIGGIGVYVSYWIQIGIALLGFLGIFLCGPGLYYFSLLALAPRYGHKEAERRARGTGSKLGQLHLPALATALTDFQKAQCFFMLAINIAALVERVHGGLQPRSLQQLYNTYILIKSISISGYLPITFNLFTLHMVDMVSWYLLVLSAFTIAVSITTLFAVGKFYPSKGDLDYLSGQAAQGGPASCGGYVPGTWCYRPLSFDIYYDATSSPSNGAYEILAFCMVVFLLLVAYHLQFQKFMSTVTRRWSLPKFTSTKSVLARWSRNSWDYFVKTWKAYLTFQARFLEHQHIRRSRRWLSDTLTGIKRMQWQQWRILSWTQSEGFQRLRRQTTRTLRTQWLLTKEAAARSHQHSKALVAEIGYPTLWKATIVLCLYITFFGLYVNFFKIFCQDLAWFASNGVDLHSWSFGQIVAITVWAAPVCEWLHLELRGMKRGFEHRLLPPYHVVSHAADEEIAKPLSSPDEYGYEQGNGLYEQLAVEMPTTPEEHRYSHDKGGYAKVEPFEESSPRERFSEEEEDITWQLPDFRRSESIRLYD